VSALTIDNRPREIAEHYLAEIQALRKALRAAIAENKALKAQLKERHEHTTEGSEDQKATR